MPCRLSVEWAFLMLASASNAVSADERELSTCSRVEQGRHKPAQSRGMIQISDLATCKCALKFENAARAAEDNFNKLHPLGRASLLAVDAGECEPFCADSDCPCLKPWTERCQVRSCSGCPACIEHPLPTATPTVGGTTVSTASAGTPPYGTPTPDDIPNSTTSPTKSPTMSSLTPSPTRSLTPTPSPTSSPTEPPTLSPTMSSPTSSPTRSLTPTPSPTSSPTESLTTSPTSSPTQSLTPTPTELPTSSPTDSPTSTPTTLSPTKLHMPETAMGCWSFCYFAFTCAAQCVNTDIGSPPQCATSGSNQCQGQWPGASFSYNGPQCQCQCQGFSFSHTPGQTQVQPSGTLPNLAMSAVSTSSLQRCKGVPESIGGKTWNNLGPVSSSQACNAACLQEDRCLYAMWNVDAMKCSAYLTCETFYEQSGPKFDVYKKSCAD